MRSAVLLLLVASGMVASDMSTTIEHGSTTNKWMKKTEPLPKETITESSTFKPESTVSPMHYTVTGKLVSGQCDCEKTWNVLENIEKSVEMIKENYYSKLAKPCIINVTSVSNVEHKVGGIFVNDVKCIECNETLTGMSLCVFDPSTGHIIDKRHFLTGITNNSNNIDAKYLTKFLEIVNEKYAVVGTTCGDAISGLNDDAKVILKVLGVDLEMRNPNDLMTFALRPKETSKALWDWKPATSHELNLTYQLVGNSTKDYSFERISPLLTATPIST